MKYSVASKRFFIVLGLIFIGIVYFGYLTLFDPRIEFLRPSSKGSWIVYPTLNMEFSLTPTSLTATYKHRFKAGAYQDKYPVRVTAMREFAIKVNDLEIPSEKTSSWKQTMTYDISPYLIWGSENEISVTVYNPEGPPALLVEGIEQVRSNENWLMRIDDGNHTFEYAAIANKGETFLVGKNHPFLGTNKYPIYILLLVGYGLFVIYAIIPRPRKSRTPNTNTIDPESKWHRYGFLLIFILPVVAVQIYNVWHYNYTLSEFDWRSHTDYIRLVAERWVVPIATQGWEMFQPPLYYLTSGIIFNIFGGTEAETIAFKAIQVFTTIIGLANIAITWWLLKTLFPQQRQARYLGLLVAAMLPIAFYMNPTISNEVFSGTMIGLAVFAAVRFGFGELFDWSDAVLIGLYCGLAILTKYTGIFILISVVTLLTLRALKRRFAWRWVLLLLATTLIIGGWHYFRNAIVFGDPFIGNWDQESNYRYEQLPGYRTSSFYTSFGSTFFHQPEHSRWASFWDGIYTSLWSDPFSTFLNYEDPMTLPLVSTILVLAILPTIAILIGFGNAFQQIIRRDWDHPYFILIITTILTIAALIEFTLEVPFFSTINARFLLSLTTSIGVFAALGMQTLSRNLGRMRWLLYANLGILYILILYTFLYQGT